MPGIISPVIFADIIDLTATDHQLEGIMDKLANTFEKSFLKINTEKTEYTIVRRCEQRHEEKWRHTKKLGMLLGDKEDMIRRKSLATFALKRLNNVWLKGKQISASLKIKLYNMFVKPVLLYNFSWALTVHEMENMNSFHRMQLKYILRIFSPNSNYNVHPLDEEIRSNRLALFDNILRMDRKTPANLAMEHHYAPHPVTTTNYSSNPSASRPNSDWKKVEISRRSQVPEGTIEELWKYGGTWKRLTKRIQERVAQAR
ncbi:uncharacterized protein LOC115229401 [Octopus sinensis]|uniref:Uncharacterized protein LOC115229401 n=1 Tax=Octopus sinensis TaxID=2607531 RepID=A0A6P7U086_9MOLL|nr:uncharacterized protein LOC115229401 [Octopus sinensis]